MAEVVAVCISAKKGTKKKPVQSGHLLVDYGLSGDAHAGQDNTREVSLLAVESIDNFNSRGYSFKPGDFAENITTRGIEIKKLPIGSKLKIGEQALLEVTQIGKKCHVSCAIFKEVGTCIMPREGIFARVIKGGVIKAGDKITIIT